MYLMSHTLLWSFLYFFLTFNLNASKVHTTPQTNTAQLKHPKPPTRKDHSTKPEESLQYRKDGFQPRAISPRSFKATRRADPNYHQEPLHQASSQGEALEIVPGDQAVRLDIKRHG